jgi:hypothetical protein
LIEVDRGIDGIQICIDELRTKGGHVIPMDLNATSAGRVAFTQYEPIGVVVGVAGMVPRWWQQRRLAKKAIQDTASAPANKPNTEAVAADMYGP